MDEHLGNLESYMQSAGQEREYPLSAQRELESVGVYLKDALIYKDAANSVWSNQQSQVSNALSNQQSQTQDPRNELSNLISENKYEEAFTNALQRSDRSIVFWLCSEVNLLGILSLSPLPLSQVVLLTLLQQLAVDLTNDNSQRSQKLNWITHLAATIDPMNPMTAWHVKVVFENLSRLCCCPSMIEQFPSINYRILQHVINSILMKISK